MTQIKSSLLETPDINKRLFLQKSTGWDFQCTLLNQKFQDLFPETNLVAPSKENQFYLPRILSQGKFIMGNEARILIGSSTLDPFRNCIELMKQGEIESIVCGFVLTPDSLFRLDFWGIDAGGKIVETRKEKLLYFG